MRLFKIGVNITIMEVSLTNYCDTWILADVSTVEEYSTIKPYRIVAQLMDGWEPVGQIFDQNMKRSIDNLDDITLDPDEIEMLNEYDVPELVYTDLQDFARNGSLCAYNLKRVYDDILDHDWAEVGKDFSVARGFCLLRLTQRLLDPFPIQGNSLIALKEFYKLKERSLEYPLGRLETVIELIQTVLKPIAVQKRLTSTYKIKEFCEEIWYPSTLTWGKFKGESYTRARDDEEMLEWIRKKSKSSNTSVSQMCSWYMDQLSQKEFPIETDELYVSADQSPISTRTESSDRHRQGLVIFVSFEKKQLVRLVEWERSQLADIEKQFDFLRHEIEKVKYVIREKLHEHYKKRDSLRLKVKYLQIRIDMYMQPTDKIVDDIDLEYKSEEEKLNQAYEETRRQPKQRTETEENPAEVNEIYRKLAKLYHPDRQSNNVSRKSHEQFMKIINRARSSNNLKLLKEIAEDPRGYCLRNDIDQIGSEVDEDLEYLRRLYKHLQKRRFAGLSELSELKESDDFELYQHSLRQPKFMEMVAKSQQTEIERECESLEFTKVKLQRELDEIEDES